jgi:hypothetical protein
MIIFSFTQSKRYKPVSISGHCKYLRMFMVYFIISFSVYGIYNLCECRLRVTGDVSTTNLLRVPAWNIDYNVPRCHSANNDHSAHLYPSYHTGHFGKSEYNYIDLVIFYTCYV